MVPLFRNAHEGWMKALVDQKSHCSLDATIGIRVFLI